MTEMLGIMMMAAANAGGLPLCADGGTIAERECWNSATEKADTELNIIWPKVRAATRRSDQVFNVPPWHHEKPSAESDLLKAQRIWIRWRDAECSARSDWAQGGTWQAVLYHQCRYTLTKERIDQLQKLLTSYTVP